MNRIQFIGLTHKEGNQVSIDGITKFFDHTIAAYEIVGDVEPSNFQSITDDLHSSLKIHIESPDATKLQDAVDYINNTIHNHKVVYGKSFAVNAQVGSENNIELYVQDETMS